MKDLPLTPPDFFTPFARRRRLRSAVYGSAASSRVIVCSCPSVLNSPEAWPINLVVLSLIGG